MIPYHAYKLAHIFGGFLMITSLGAICGLTIAAGSETASAAWIRARKLAGIGHGVALLVILVGGFGALARLGLGGIPVFVWIKVGIWLVLGAAPALIRRRPETATAMLFAVPVIAALAAAMAIFKVSS